MQSYCRKWLQNLTAASDPNSLPQVRVEPGWGGGTEGWDVGGMDRLLDPTWWANCWLNNAFCCCKRLIWAWDLDWSCWKIPPMPGWGRPTLAIRFISDGAPGSIVGAVGLACGRGFQEKGNMAAEMEIGKQLDSAKTAQQFYYQWCIHNLVQIVVRLKALDSQFNPMDSSQ